MTPITRSSNIAAGGPVATLTGLTEAQITTRTTTYGIKSIENLILMEPADISDIFGNDAGTFLTRKKLSVLIRFLCNGGNLTAATTMNEVSEVLRVAPTSNTASSITSHSSASAPIKLSPSDIPEFLGEIEDQETYRTKIEAMVGQTTFKFLLTRAPANVVERERDEELFNVFKASFFEGNAYHLVTSSLLDPDNPGVTLAPSGYRLWQRFLKWCNSGGRKDALVKKIKDDLRELRLDGQSIDGLSYVNTFITKHSELDRLEASVPMSDRMSAFVDNIDDNDFHVVKELLQGIVMKVDRGEAEFNPKEFYDSIEARQRVLDKEVTKDMETKSRRQPVTRKRGSSPGPNSGYKSDSSETSKNSESKRLNLSLPPALFSSLSEAQKSAFGIWRRAKVNGKQVDEDKIAKLLKQNPTSGGSKSKGKKSSKNKKKKVRALKVRRTNSQVGKTKTEEVRLLMRSDSESESDSEDLGDTNLPVKNQKKVAANRVVRKAVSSVASSPSNDFKYQTILDTGTEWSVVGGPAWTITSTHLRSMKISAVDGQMEHVKLSMCDAVSAVTDGDGIVHILGVRSAGYSPTLSDNEAVVNTHFIRESGLSIDDQAKRHGGAQSLFLSPSSIVPLEYDPNAYKIYVRCRAPTPDELENIQIKWIDCHVEDLDIDDGRKPVRRADRRFMSGPHSQLIIPGQQPSPSAVEEREKDTGGRTMEMEENKNAADTTTLPNTIEATETEDPSQSKSALEVEKTATESTINWSKTLGHCPDAMVKLTLANTTQYFDMPIESETRAYPRQHWQRRLQLLHVRRLPERTCADTFFSSVRSVRGYTCIQLFVALFADFLWVKCLRRKSKVPGAYSDFVNEVGAPNELLTDNSKVQSGERFVKIDRKSQTKHNYSSPYCQNQNPAERRIQDVKHRSILVLFAANAPLVFWCYCVEFIVECLNHTSKVKLKNKTPEEVMNSNTPDISVFRFEFW